MRTDVLTSNVPGASTVVHDASEKYPIVAPTVMGASACVPKFSQCWPTIEDAAHA